jgi:hypothetical protein
MKALVDGSSTQTWLARADRRRALADDAMVENRAGCARASTVPPRSAMVTEIIVLGVGEVFVAVRNETCA